MDSTGGCNVGVQMEGESALSFPSSSVMVNSTSDEALTISKVSSDAHPHPFFSAGWNSLVQLDRRENLVSRSEPFGSNYQPEGNQVIRGGSSLFHSQSVTDSRMAYFGSRNQSEAVAGYLSMPEFLGIPDSRCPPSFGSYMNNSGGNEMNLVEGRRTHECQNSQDGVGINSPTNERTRKRSPDSRSSFGPNENNNNNKSNTNMGDVSDAQAEKKQKHGQNECPSIPKQNTRQAKDNMSGEEVPKETYIHVRARKGQATNSHSLAERIRREKISERMRMLQELVPGCSKITGKAVMLDEIINYVQSLQQQVEFLSMKLSTLIPDLSFDAGKPLLMDMNSNHASGTAMGLGNTGLGSFQHFPPGMSKGTLPISLSTAQYLSLTQLPFDSELHALFQMGFDSNSGDILKPEGHLKPEQ